MYQTKLLIPPHEAQRRVGSVEEKHLIDVGPSAKLLLARDRKLVQRCMQTTLDFQRKGSACSDPQGWAITARAAIPKAGS